MAMVVRQKDFNQAIKAVSKVINRKPHLAVLAGIHLKFSETELELTSTDLVAGMKVKIPLTAGQDIQVVVIGKILAEAVAFFEQELTEIELEEKLLILKNGRDQVKIPLLLEEYPDFQLPKKIKFSPTNNTFWQYLDKRVAFAASSDQTRPVLTAILLNQQGEFKTVCTDGFRLVVYTPAKNNNLNLEKNLLLSRKSLQDIVSLLDDKDNVQLEFAYDGENEQFFFRNQNFLYFSKAIGGNYPPFEKIIPLEFKTTAEFDKQIFAKNLNKAAIFSRSQSNTVNLTFSQEGLLFSADNSHEGSFAGEQPLISFTGEEIEISFNIRYLQDFINTIDGEIISFACNDKNTPAAFTDPNEKKITYIVMPFKPKR